jgi:hypothetical protein
MNTRFLFATFIGIGDYKQVPLGGCIKDVLGIDQVLRNLCVQQGKDKLKYEPYYLLAPTTTDRRRISDHETSIGSELKYDRPTFENISKKAFAHFKVAKDGDICVLFYSGHGSQTDAPEVFWHSKPDHMNETIVCIDSRDSEEPDARDLIDKELGYLIWDALGEKKVHCLVIMDCCHSGNNLRDIDNSGVRYRHVPSSRKNIPLEQYIGYDTTGRFYQVKENKASIRTAKYVQLSACRDFEKALENSDGGLFTSKLVDLLRAGGTGRSYRDLVDSLSISVRNRAGQQNPVAFARDDNDLDLQFLGGGFIPYKPTFPVRFNTAQQKWILYGGSMQGLVPSDTHAKTTITIPGFEDEIEILEVKANTSILNPEATGKLNKEEQGYSAILASLANPAIKIGISAGLTNAPDLHIMLRQAYNEAQHLFFSLDFDDAANAEYLVQADIDNNYVLTRAKSEVPLFKREADAGNFLTNVEVVGKWINASELKNSSAPFSSDDFIFELEKIEGENFNIINPEDTKGVKSNFRPGDELVFSYVGELQPAFRLNILINPRSKIEECFIGILYLESKFGIIHNFIRPDAGRLVKNGGPVQLSYLDGTDTYTTIPLFIDPLYPNYNINEITEVMKIFVSNKPVDLEKFKQSGLKLDDSPNVRFREVVFARSVSAADNTKWTVFTNKIRVHLDNKEKMLHENAVTEFSSFNIEVPNGFNAKAFAATGDDVQRKIKTTAARDLNENEKVPDSIIAPPQHIWGDVITNEAAFGSGMSSISDNAIQVLELLPEQENASLRLSEKNPLKITPKQLLSIRSIDDPEETTIPYGFDEESQLYFPVGFSDDKGVIHIEHLPPPSPGRIIGDQPNTRSIGGSVKLFFKKIFQNKNGTRLNTLLLYGLDENNDWKVLTEDPLVMARELAKKPGTRAVLLIHGIIGDTKEMITSFREMKELKASVSFLVTYDYENLATPVTKTAASLLADLEEAGFNNSASPELVVVAHSMGGLVIRYLIEHLKKPLHLNHLILVGTPSAGSEISGFGKSVKTLLIHAMNVTGPIKYTITGLAFLMKKLSINPGTTLTDMGLNSDLLKMMNEKGKTLPAGTIYTIVAGDTLLIEKGYEGSDFFLKKLAEILMKKVVYPGLTMYLYKDKPNDMAVTIESMKSVPGFNDQSSFHVVVSDHISYFEEKQARELLRSLIQPAN